ncbi:hypothetical protein ACFVVQ_13820 [Paenibacillus chitinolyticus]|uniref:hypothetical protein n=1 Tax=Paenibacillus chitinolyticus TaxID=79263 RepID=UPI0036D93D74
MKLTILPQLPGEVKINSYGFNSFYKEIPSAKLFNSGTGEEIPYTQDETFPNSSEIYWERGKEAEGGAKLVIPALVLTRSYDQPAETLYEFPPSLLNGGAVWHRNEQTDKLEWMLLSVQRGQKEYELKVTSFHTRVEGPWEFSVDQP